LDRISNQRCENEIQWSLQRLKPSNSWEVGNMIFDTDEKIKSGTNGEWIIDVVCVGYNVAIITKSGTYEQS
jgi:hypothetical protein